MFRIAWIFAIAVGLAILSAPIILKKVCEPPIRIQEFVSDSGQNHSATNGQPRADKDIKNAGSFVSALNRVESAIRDAIPKEDQKQNQWIVDKDIRDLTAQENMAFEACRMFWATYGTMFIGFLGVCFIWRDISNSRDMGRAQSRAYLTIEEAEFNVVGGFIKVDLTINNLGQTPSLGLVSNWEIKAGSKGLFVPQVIWEDTKFGGPDIVGGASQPEEFGVIFAQDGDPKIGHVEKSTHLWVIVTLYWEDVFNQWQYLRVSLDGMIAAIDGEGNVRGGKLLAQRTNTGTGAPPKQGLKQS